MTDDFKITDRYDDVIIGDSKTDRRAHFYSVDAFIDYNDTQDTYAYNIESEWTDDANGDTLKKIINDRAIADKYLCKIEKVLLVSDEALEKLAIDEPQINTTYSDIGVFCDMAAYNAEDYDNCMIDIEVKNAKSKTVWLAVNLISDAGVTADGMILRGVAFIQLANTLISKGYNVGIIGYCYGSKYTNNAPKNAFVEVVVKRPDEPFNDNLICAAIAHPSFFRTLMHNTVAKIYNTHSGGMGSADAPTKDTFSTGFANPDDVLIMNPSFNLKEFRNRKTATQWVLDTVNTLVND